MKHFHTKKLPFQAGKTVGAKSKLAFMQGILLVKDPLSCLDFGLASIAGIKAHRDVAELREVPLQSSDGSYGRLWNRKHQTKLPAGGLPFAASRHCWCG